MEEIKKLCVTKTKYNNLPQEMLVLFNSFYPHQQYILEEEEPDVIIQFEKGHFFVRNISDGIEESFKLEKEDFRRECKVKLFDYLTKKTGISLPWGILMGIRPTKLVYKLKPDEKAVKEAKAGIVRMLEDSYRVSKEMAELAVNVAAEEEAYLPKGFEPNLYSLYVSIPFCPTRCHYCSFPANALGKWEADLDHYVDCVLKEVKSIVNHIGSSKKISTIYIGGGTPTSLNPQQLDKLITQIKGTVNMDDVKEFTVEAGRPDTITREKLEVLKKHKIDRISINPQSMNQCTLDIIGRKHTADEIVKAYYLAKEVGIKRINMDLILGLPDETLKEVKATLDEVIKLNPSEITVHTLAIKRSSIIHEEMDKYHLPDHNETKELLDYTRKLLTVNEGYKPYYLYRQKNMVGSFENVGYYKGDRPCIYNMEIMEEIINIIACGAGGITKLIDVKGKVCRVENVKNAGIYMERIDDMIKRKLDKLTKS